MPKTLLSILTQTNVLLFILLSCVVLATFAPVFQSAYMLNFDDNVHFFYNAMTRSTNWQRAPLDIFFTPDNVNATYVPLTTLSFFYENFFFGMRPVVSHAINLFLHLSVCGAAFCLGRALGLRVVAAFAGIVIFAIHPLHVEPVAWVTARKDLLYSFFYIAAMISYLRFIDNRNGKDYIFALLTAGLSVLSKPMALSLPLILFLLDWYKGRAFSWRLLIEKIPFLLVIEPTAFITYAMNARAIGLHEGHSFLVWVWCATFYLKKFFLPVNLSALYNASFPVRISNPEYLISCAILTTGVLSAIIWRHSKLFLFAILFYALSLFFIWRFDFYDLTFVADRFMYLPSLGICFLMGFFIERWLESRYSRLAAIGLFSLLIMLMSLSFQRSSVWKNSYSLWTDVLKNNPTAFVLTAYGESLLEPNCFKDNRDDFIRDISASLKTSPQKFKEKFQNSLEPKLTAVRQALALRVFTYAMLLNPAYAEPADNIGVMLLRFKRYERAVTFFNKAISTRDKGDGTCFYHRGLAYEYLGRPDLSLEDYKIAIDLGGEAVISAYLNTANILLKRGELQLALRYVIQAISEERGQIRSYELAIRIAEANGDKALAANFRRLQSYYAKRLPHAR